MLTKPHLLGADHYHQFINGLSPDPEKHDIEVLVEPVSGNLFVL